MFALLLILSLFLGTAAFAWFTGDGPERCGALVLVATCALGLLRMSTVGLETSHVDMFGFLSDIAVLAAQVSIALFAWRIWPIWAASLQLLAVVAHVVRALQIEIHPVVYELMRAAPTYTIWLVLLAGTLNRIRLKRANVEVPCWRNWSTP